ncbi:MAG: Na+/H+ antiporter NhaC [Thermoanaerobacterales bacterium]|nr:Na+/H+ antiporter NhaC [Thermoanaerobacterales bacterium]
MTRESRAPKFWEALTALTIIFLVIIIGLKLNTGLTAPLVAGSFIAGLFGLYLGYGWPDLQTGMIQGIANALPCIMILMLVGLMIGIWIIGGTVPVMIYYGLQILTPQLFLPATFILCCIVSLATGTSWGTIGTMGLALIGIGQGLNIPLPIVAGAIVSGAYFGDKMSPLSDTTNVAPAMAGAELFEHIGSMLYTTIPATIVSIILYTFLGFRGTNGSVSTDTVSFILNTLSSSFNISLLALVPPVLVILMSVRRIPAIPALSTTVIFSMFWAMLSQGVEFSAIVSTSINGFVSNTGVAAVDVLLSRGGLNSMMGIISMVLLATALGGILERTGILTVIINTLLKKVKSAGSLIFSVLVSSYAILLVSGNSMLAIILPGRTFRDAFAERKIEPRVLSRTLEDAGTIGTVLIPWSAAGLYVYGILDVPVLSFAPYAFLNWTVPIFSIIFAYTGFAVFKIKESKRDE